MVRVEKIVWANDDDLPRFEELNKKLGYRDKNTINTIMWSRQWEYGFAKEYLDKLPKNPKILDVGITSLDKFKHFLREDFKVTTCDLLSTDKYVGEFVKCDIKDNPFDDDSFDCVLCISTIEHDDDPLSCVREMWRVLKPGGVLILTIDHAVNDGKIQIAGLTKIIEFFNKKVPPIPPNAILSEKYCQWNGLRVIGVIAYKNG